MTKIIRPLADRPRMHSARVWCPILLTIALCGANTPGHEKFEGWNLEPGIAQAHLVMVARVVSVSRVTVVEGAKTDVSLREYRFQPVRRLKGIFQRDQLSMTAADMGCFADEGGAGSSAQGGRVPTETRDAIFEVVAPLVLDPYLNLQVRQAGLRVLRLLRGPDYEKFSDALADEAELEGSPLLDALLGRTRDRRLWGC